MFELSFGEILLVLVVSLLVLGPQRLPQAARTLGRWLGKVQGFVAGVKQDFSHQSGMAEFREARSQLETMARDLRHDVETSLADMRHDLAAHDSLPPWERLPAQRTPADFGIVEPPAPVQAAWPRLSLRQQAMQRRRQIRPRRPVRPQLRVRRHTLPE